MKRQISYPSIEKFETAVGTVKHNAEWIDKKVDDNGDIIYDTSVIKPIVTFKGTVKLHGTNASVVLHKNELWAQSRDRIIVVGDDNAGFAGWVKQNEHVLKARLQNLAEQNGINLDTHILNVYGEWAGKGISAGSAGIGRLPKAFYIFGAKVTDPSIIVDPDHQIAEQTVDWLDSSGISIPTINVYNIEDFKTFHIKIDFNDPWSYIPEIEKLTLEVENECPVSRAIVNSMSEEDLANWIKQYHVTFEEVIGEGIVWTGNYAGIRMQFKTKGDRHAPRPQVPKAKLEANQEKNDAIRIIVDQVTPGWRLEQFLVSTCNLNNQGIIETRFIGEYIKNIQADINKEDWKILQDSGFTTRELNQVIGHVAREYFLLKQKEQQSA